MQFYEVQFFFMMHNIGKITAAIYKLLAASLGMWMGAAFPKKFRGSSVSPRSSVQQV